MDITKETIDRILSLGGPSQIEYQRSMFVDRQMSRLPKCQTASPLTVHTLSAVRDYITNHTDGDADGLRFVVHVEDYNSVILYRELNGDRKRECLLKAEIDNSTFPFGRFMDLESFIINLQSGFVLTESLRELLSFAGNVTGTSNLTQTDDGVSQVATVKTGIAVVGNKLVPNPVALQPWRTFTEVEQPESDFVFRLRKNGEREITAALIEADGSVWKRAAIRCVGEWLAAELESELGTKVIILS